MSPIYTYECEACQLEEEHSCSIAERHEQTCSKCGNSLKMILAKSTCEDPNAHERKRFPYFDEQLNVHLTSQKQKEKILKERGLVQHDGFFSKGKRKKVLYFT